MTSASDKLSTDPSPPLSFPHQEEWAQQPILCTVQHVRNSIDETRPNIQQDYSLHGLDAN